MKRAQGAVGGGLLIVCAFVFLWSSSSTRVRSDGSLRTLAARAITIDAANPDPDNNGRLVAAAAQLRSAERFEDEFLKPSPLLSVQRHVEMYQWVESKNDGGSAPSYMKQWHEGQVDFFTFKVQEGHENPLFQVEPTTFVAQTARFGGFDGTKIVSLIKKLEVLPLTSELLKDPSHEIIDNKIYLRREAGQPKPTLGDMRVWYEVVPQGDYSVMSVQFDERSLVGPSSSGSLFIRKGLFSADELVEDLGEEASSSARGVLLLGGFLLFFGSISLLMPMASSFDLRPHMNAQGALAVFVVSAGVSLLVVGIFFLLSFTR